MKKNITEARPSTTGGGYQAFTQRLRMRQEQKAARPNYASAHHVFRSAMAEAMIPKEGPRSPVVHKQQVQKEEVPPEQTQLDRARKQYGTSHLMSYVRTEPTLTQTRLAAGEYLCMCPPLMHCGKLATLHRDPCTFCHGPPPGGPPFFFRYYPQDNGWWTLRHQVKRLRAVCGLEDYEDAICFVAKPITRQSAA